MIRILVMVLSLTAAVTVAACNTVDPIVCTQIGCSDGLRVEIDGSVETPVTVTVTTSTGETQSRIAQCSGSERCGVFFEDFTPDEVTVTWEAAGETGESTFTPTYEAVHPNGEDCPPECMIGTIDLVIG